MSTDEEISEIAEVDPMAALMWPWLLTYFDDWGRAKASPREIKNSVFQANELITIDHIKKALQLYKDKLIQLYEVGGKWYMAIPQEKWFKFQTHVRQSKREKDDSKIPPPPDDNSAQVREDAREVAENSVDARIYTPSPSPSPSLSPSPSKDSTTTDGQTNPFRFYELERFGFLSTTIRDKIEVMIDRFSERWVIEAMKEAVYHDKKNLPYVNQILEDWYKKNHSEPWTLPRDKSKGGRNPYARPNSRDAPADPGPDPDEIFVRR